MAHGLNSVLKRGAASGVGCKSEGKSGIGSRRIFAPHFKLQVLDSYRNDSDCKGNQRATARKYGIHRRQIQKWLQVEGNLRNSVGKCGEARKCEAAAAAALAQSATGPLRQRGDAGSPLADARVPSPGPLERSPATPPAVPGRSAPPTPLDFSTHSRGRASPPVARPEPLPADPAAPMDLSLKKAVAAPAAAPVPAPLPPPRSPPGPGVAPPHPDVWDLSTKSPLKPVKLFKPYLDDVSSDDPASPPSDDGQMFSPPCCTAYHPSLVGCDSSSLYYNHNNNLCEIKSEYPYGLHELQAKGYYYTPQVVYQSPDFEMGDCCSTYEDISYSQTLKQRQSYSLDFKLSAIDCYYQDSVCRGNQRAVASKYNVHRRQVQKWLKQAEELRQRNESVKHIHAVVS